MKAKAVSNLSAPSLARTVSTVTPCPAVPAQTGNSIVLPSAVRNPLKDSTELTLALETARDKASAIGSDTMSTVDLLNTFFALRTAANAINSRIEAIRKALDIPKLEGKAGTVPVFVTGARGKSVHVANIELSFRSGYQVGANWQNVIKPA
jgi:hypothetical protein